MKYRNLLVFFTSMLLLAGIFAAILNLLNNSAKQSNTCSSGQCSGCNGCSGITQGKSTINSSYYTEKEDKLLETLSEKEKTFKNVLEDSLSKDDIERITQETTDEFKTMIPQIPYIGGDENPMTEDIEQAAMVLAFYRVENRYGKTVDEVGNIVYSGIEVELQKYPKWLMRLSGSQYFTNAYINQLKSQAALSQEKRYSQGWVSDFVQVDGETFDYGYNFTECAIVKYYNEQNASALTPYLCKLDYLYSDYMDEGLVRTTTLAQGEQSCNFRYKQVENLKLDIQTRIIIGAIGISVLLIMALILRSIYLKYKRNHPKGQ